MTAVSRVDIVIVGGGWVGLVAAAALAEQGRTVLVLEARPGSDPRLRGELVHAKGARVLRALGLEGALVRAGAREVRGFSVHTGAGDESLALAYGASRGLAMDHQAMVDALRIEAAGRPGVTIQTGARVTDVWWEGGRVAGVRLADGALVRAGLTVVADGRNSKLRARLGLEGDSRLLSFTAGLRLQGATLPREGYGTVMHAPLGPALAYEVGPGQVRMCLDVPIEQARGARGGLAGTLSEAYGPHVVSSLREPLLRALSEGELELCANQSVTTDRVMVPGAVLLGDAAGCSHPLSAGGMTLGALDVLSLRAALRGFSTIASGDALDVNLRAHERARYRFARGREVLAQALYDVFAGRTAGARVLREGMFRYWRESERARRASMALLSGEDDRLASFAREYVIVMGHAAAALGEERAPSSVSPSAVLPALSARVHLGRDAWNVARLPLARSARIARIELLRAVGRRPDVRPCDEDARGSTIHRPGLHVGRHRTRDSLANRP
jgi:squalene monooxygenase